MVQLNLKVTFSSFEKREHELDGIEGPVFLVSNSALVLLRKVRKITFQNWTLFPQISISLNKWIVHTEFSQIDPLSWECTCEQRCVARMHVYVFLLVITMGIQRD